MMNIVIYEDSLIHRSFLVSVVREYINSFCDINLDLATGDQTEIERYIEKNKMFTLYFLDIVDKDERNTGFELAECIKRKDSGSEIVFITQYMNRIINKTLHKVSALNIIPKHSTGVKRDMWETIEYAYRKLPSDDFLLINSGYGDIFRVAYDDIYTIETVKNSHKVCIRYKNGVYEFKGVLKDIFAKLDGRFKYCHRCIIVNIGKVELIRKNPREIVFGNGLTCPYSINFDIAKEVKSNVF